MTSFFSGNEVCFELFFVYLRRYSSVMDIRKIHIILLQTSAIALILCSCHGSSGNQTDANVRSVQDSLKRGRFGAAMRIIEQQKAEAADSDTYYRWLSVETNAWYTKMNVDSMLVTSERTHQYLMRNQQQNDPAKNLLWAEWYKFRGVFYSAVKGMPDSAVIYTKMCLDKMKGLANADELYLTALTNLAFYHTQLGQYDLSVDYYMKAISLADSLGMGNEARSALLLGISTVYTYMGDYQRSRYWWDRTRPLLPVMTKADQFIYYNDRGNDYYFQQEYAKAKECFVKAAALVRGDDAKEWDYYTSLTNLSEVYTCLSKPDSAKMALLLADSFFRKVNFTPLLYYLETTDIKLKMLEGHTSQALDMIMHPRNADPQIPLAKIQRLKAVEQIMAMSGRYREAYEANSLMKALSDSMQTANNSMLLSARLMEYRHDKHLLEQQHSLDKARNERLLAWGLLIIVAMGCIILIILFMQYRRRKRFEELKTRQQIVLMRMENMRNRITPHFIYNALSHEMLAKMEGREIDLDALTQLLRRGVEQAGILETTLQEELAFVDYYVNIEGRQMGADFVYEKEIADDVDVQKVRLPSMTVQIFAENALKHGLRPMKPVAERQRKLSIVVSRKQGATLVEVLDNGNGIDYSAKGTQTGTRVVRQTIQMLNDENSNKIMFGVENRRQEAGVGSQETEKGCRSWILLPDEYDYQIKKTD